MTCRGSQQSHIAYAVDALLIPRPPIIYLLSGMKKSRPEGRQLIQNDAWFKRGIFQ